MHKLYLEFPSYFDITLLQGCWITLEFIRHAYALVVDHFSAICPPLCLQKPLIPCNLSRVLLCLLSESATNEYTANAVKITNLILQ